MGGYEVGLRLAIRDRQGGGALHGVSFEQFHGTTANLVARKATDLET